MTLLTRRSITYATAAAVLIIAPALPAHAETNPSERPAHVVEAERRAPLPPLDGTFPEVVHLTLPPVPDGMLRSAEALAEAFATDPQVASVGIAEDRSAIEIYWHGERSSRLDAAIAATDQPVAVLASRYSPADLRSTAAALLEGSRVCPLRARPSSPTGRA
ncbi:hypothetical protein [Cellulomonas biazotea]|uniref:Uncharacterized protein n=1 Tax=Cellulomonas biazotea TaxID=1709 RepID=A0A402DQC5_9CELL|nr:hypothetical protein [Cellulomonas biazotea]GCE76340.1 hypothetical protein CBZ_13960 [Cellulomonas biazotea]